MNYYTIYVCDEFKHRDSMKYLCRTTEEKLPIILKDLILNNVGEVRTLDIYKETGLSESENEIRKINRDDAKRMTISEKKLDTFLKEFSLEKLNTFIQYLYVKKEI